MLRTMPTRPILIITHVTTKIIHTCSNKEGYYPPHKRHSFMPIIKCLKKNQSPGSFFAEKSPMVRDHEQNPKPRQQQTR